MTQEHTPFQTLQFRVAEAHWRWGIWKQLYMGDRVRPKDGQERIDLMNGLAPAFFDVVRGLLVDDVILRVCKLTDPHDSPVKGEARRQNLSLANAIEVARGQLTPAAITQAEALLTELKKSVVELKRHRDRTVAHDDLLVARGDETRPKVTDTIIDRALADAVGIMNLIDVAFPDRHYQYAEMISPGGDGATLIYALRCADRYQRECREQGRRPLE